MKNKAFTLIELLAVIVILGIILAIAVPGIKGIINDVTKNSFQSNAKLIIKALDYKMAEDDSFDPTSINRDNIESNLKLSADNYSSVTVTLVNDKPYVTIVGKDKWNGLTAYGKMNDMKVVDTGDYDVTSPVITLVGNNPTTVYKGDTYTDAGATASDNHDGNITNKIVIVNPVNASTVGTYTVTYNVSDNAGNAATQVTRTVNVVDNFGGPGYIASKGVNGPVLATGMTPIKWNGTTWVDTTVSDTTWYNYDTTNKQWANARTADGSMWVWIPRYAYQIITNYHTSTVGTINIKFLQNNTNTASDSSTVSTTPTYSGSSQTNYIIHPAFTFGTTEITGIWVAKFEASGTTSTIDSKPNVTPIVSIIIDSMFTASRNMETNSRYGWGTSGTNIDTHMMKNTEWGAVAYLSQSTYGKNAEIWINPADYYTTGCAGDSASSVYTTGCLRTYDTVNGQKASSNGNIYGIYDMSGGAMEYTIAYVNNSNTSLTTYGNSIVLANAKYKDVYTVTTDDRATNYNNASSKKGDALYETSLSSNGSTSWNSDFSYMPTTTTPWFLRGGFYDDGTNAGMFNFYYADGRAYNGGFRCVVLVGAGL